MTISAEKPSRPALDLVRPALEAAGVVVVATVVVVLLIESFLIVFDAAVDTTVLRFVGVASGAVLGAAAAGYLVHRRAQSALAAVEEDQLLPLQAENARNRALLDAILETAPAGIFLLDQGKRIVASNKLAADVHGVEQVLGEKCQRAFGSPPDHCAVCAVTRSRKSGEVHRDAGNSIIPKTGEAIRRTAHPLELPDWGGCTLVIDQIVTEHQKLQASMLHQEKMAAFGLLAAGIAHDMGNPLSSIQMHLQLLEGESLPEDAASSLGFVRQEVARLHRSLRELVDFARRRRAAASFVSVQSVVDDTLRLLRYDRRMKDIEVSFEADPDTPGVFMVEDHLVQVCLNLIVNALDAMPDGGKLKIELGSVGGEVSLRIRDSGIGFSPKVLERCYEPLFTTKAEGKGTGLGLSISREILRAAGGDVELHSREGHGATAIVRLPASDGDAANLVKLPTAVGEAG